jgi:histidinol phosphatase-like PHP family hydrolase
LAFGALIWRSADLINTMKKHGVQIQTASDAHCPEDVGLYIKEMETILGGA